jgi:hypothetical protein
MANAHDLNQEDAVVDLVEDPVVADPDPVRVLFASELHAAGRSRRLSEQVDGGSNSLLLWSR